MTNQTARPFDRSPLTIDDDFVTEFVSHGFVQLRQAVDLGPGSRLNRLFERTLRQEGLLRDGQVTCPEGVTSLPPSRVAELADVAPVLWSAVCTLLGGADRIKQPALLSNAFICNYRTSKLSDSWHVDGDFFVHHPDSPEQALLIFVLWSDVEEGEGATRAAPSATADILAELVRHPEGLTSAQIPVRRFASAAEPHLSLTGKAGDAWILHPLTAHQAVPNPHGDPRFISNPAIALKDPLNLTAEAQRTPVEELTYRLLGQAWEADANSIRRTFVPDRIARWDAEGAYTDEVS